MDHQEDDDMSTMKNSTARRSGRSITVKGEDADGKEVVLTNVTSIAIGGGKVVATTEDGKTHALSTK